MIGVAITRGVRRRPRVKLPHWVEALLFVAALAVRLIPEMINGAVTGNYGYDPAVYYAAADSLINGRTPYRDFILLHPPGIVLVDAPFAWFGSITTDRLGFATLTGFFALLSATSAVLVTRVARHLGMPPRACLIAGVVYALWFGSLIAEYEPRLEPLGCFLLLCGLLALLASRERPPRSRRSALFALLAGFVFGALISVKIWWAVPVGVLMLWELVVGRAVRRVAVIAAGIAAAGLLIDGPFLLAAGSKMWTMVVLDQLGRPPNTPNALNPMAYLVAGWPTVNSGETGLRVAVILGGVLLVVLVLRAWRLRLVRGIVLLLLAQLGVIIAEPTWFQFYADYVTVSLSLVIAAACVRRGPTVTPRRPSPRPVNRVAEGRRPLSRDASPWLAAVITVVLAGAIGWTVPEKILVTGVPATRLAEAAKGYRCLMTDSPIALIDMNLLTAQLRRGCPNWVDVTGLIFILDHEYPGIDVIPTWNINMMTYLRSGDAMLFFRPPASLAISYSTARLIEQDGAVAQVGRFTLYQVRDDGGQARLRRTSRAE